MKDESKECPKPQDETTLRVRRLEGKRMSMRPEENRIEQRGLPWFDHITRMNDHRWPCKMFRVKPTSKEKKEGLIK